MKAFGISEKGGYREENQDSILIREKGNSGLFLVADGVGGASNGAKVSRLIADTYKKWWEEEFLQNRKESFSCLFHQIKKLAEQINEDACQRFGTGKSGSTLVLLFVHKGIYGYLSAGDSRLYTSTRGKIRVLTRDDVWENRPGADKASEHTGKILSAVGGYERLEYSCATDKTSLGQVFMLCSDGIYKYIDSIFLKKELQSAGRSFRLRKDTVEEIVKKAVENDTRDNYSAIVLKV